MHFHVRCDYEERRCSLFSRMTAGATFSGGRFPFTLVFIVCLIISEGRTREVLWPGTSWKRAQPEAVGMDGDILKKARDYALTGGGSGRIIRYGRIVLEWGDQKKRYSLKSTTKSFGATALGVALTDGKLKLTDRAVTYHPSLGVPPEENKRTGWLDEITIFHLATQTAGFEKPGGYEKLVFRAGTKWNYSDGGPNWLAECLTLIYKKDLNDMMFERVFTPIGIRSSELSWRQNSYRPKKIDGMVRREFGSGIRASVDALSRIGCLYLQEGRWNGSRILSREFVKQARTTPSQVKGLPVLYPDEYGDASSHYGLLWWNNNDGTLSNVPRDAYWSWGLYDSWILVLPSLDIVAVRAGRSIKRTGDEHYDVLKGFFEPIVASVKDKRGGKGTTSEASLVPYPPSPIIKRVEWAPVDTIIRKAEGSDNWPLAWADDGSLYAAYGDGWGFEPKTEKKLSLGIAKITGSPPSFTGRNIRTETGERTGGGARGAKASGMLCVDGVLYMLVRNTGNAQIAWSKTHGASWSWCSWKFTEGFGAPCFLNFGQDYAGSRDDFVYIYSHDAPTAYEAADTMVLARVPADRILKRSSYEFFRELDRDGRPVWTKDIHARGSVFTHKGNCYRSQVTYNAGLKRYLWCQTLPASTHSGGPRFQGGFGIYDASEPWGPWTTVFFTKAWDVGPGETSSLPAKWMSSDGTACHLVFSGDDHFSVRKAVFDTNK